MNEQNQTPTGGILDVISGNKPIRTSIEFDLLTTFFFGLMLFLALTGAMVIAKKI